MKYKALKDMATITMGQSPDSSSYNEEKNGIPFYQGNADFGELYPTARVWCSKPKKIARENDILISVRAPIGALNYAIEECCIGRGLAAITVENDFERNYVFHFLKAKNKELNNKGTGSTFKAISKSVLEEIQVPVISKEQQEISMKLMDIIEQIIRQRKQELQRLDELTKARFVEMFGDPLSNNRNWSIMALTQVCQDIYGGGTPSKSHPEYFTGTIPWISPKDMKTDMISDSIDHITNEAINNSTTNLVPANSILMVIRSGILKHTLPVAINNVPVTINQDMKAFVPNDVITAEFLMYYFKAIAHEVLAGVRSVTADNIDFKAFQKRRIIVPPIELQNQFADFVTQIDKSKVTVQKALEETQLLFDSLMQKYFG